eukprot:Lankesteria_metandrocarpae@DN4342_c0_g1_i1.p1
MHLLNCLFEEYIPNSLSLVKPGGHFLELGKRDIWTKRAVADARPDVKYHVIAVDDLMDEDPAWYNRLLIRVRDKMQRQEWGDMPLKIFELSEIYDNTLGAVAAMRYLQKASHIGKVVLTVGSAVEHRFSVPHRGPTAGTKIATGTDVSTVEQVNLTEEKNKTYLITGGTGALGVVVARWLVDEGASNIVLVSRSGEPTSESKMSLQALLNLGDVRIETVKCDVSDKQDVKRLFKTITEKKFPPVRGILHAAGLLRDVPLNDQTEETITAVFAPKARGAWHLHEVCEELGLNKQMEAFVMFSSVASALGNFNQCNYSAANAVVDAIAEHRQAKGLCGQSIQWGAWIEQGMAGSVAKLLTSVGMQGISNDVGLRVLGDIMKYSNTCVTMCQAFNWKTFLRRYGGEGVPSWYSSVGFVVTDKKDASPTGGAFDWRAMTEEQRRSVVESEVTEIASLVLSTSDVPPLDSPLQELGIDSLGAVEFRNALQQKLGVRLSATAMFDYPTLRSLVNHIDFEVSKQISSRPTTASPMTRTVPLDFQFSTDSQYAIVGAALRLPGSCESLQSYWSMLCEESDCIVDVPLSRWDMESSYDVDPDMANAVSVRQGGFIDKVDEFDHTTFNINAAEVSSMDPQQRLLLEVSRQTFASASVDPASLVDSDVGVFIGAANTDWHYVDQYSASAFSGTGGSSSILAGRLSYNYGLKGPSFVVDTACSSSLVAVELAMAKLRDGSCKTAFVGGVNIMLSPQLFASFNKSRMLSPDGRCKTFDMAANGYE